jgi:transcriptional regulator with XRE-family HTH domain
MRKFRERPRDYRELLWRELTVNDMTQYELARLCNIGPETINRIINGRRPPTEEHVLRIALAFLTAEQKEIVNRHLDSASLYTIPVEEIGGGRHAGEPDRRRRRSGAGERSVPRREHDAPGARLEDDDGRRPGEDIAQNGGDAD